MVYFCDFGSLSLVAYFSGSGLTDCEWLYLEVMTRQG
jgi:hypothetical protein